MTDANGLDRCPTELEDAARAYLRAHRRFKPAYMVLTGSALAALQASRSLVHVRPGGGVWLVPVVFVLLLLAAAVGYVYGVRSAAERWMVAVAGLVGEPGPATGQRTDDWARQLLATAATRGRPETGEAP